MVLVIPVALEGPPKAPVSLQMVLADPSVSQAGLRKALAARVARSTESVVLAALSMVAATLEAPKTAMAVLATRRTVALGSLRLLLVAPAVLFLAVRQMAQTPTSLEMHLEDLWKELVDQWKAQVALAILWKELVALGAL